MKEIHGNLWDADCDAIVITTNGTVKQSGEAVMGRGVARQAAKKWPHLPMIWGTHLTENGNHVRGIRTLGPYIVFFPVKAQWWQVADVGLIKRSTQELVEIVDEALWMHVALPRPGCGNGGLGWKMVKSVIEPLLDDRFVVYNND